MCHKVSILEAGRSCAEKHVFILLVLLSSQVTKKKRRKIIYKSYNALYRTRVDMHPRTNILRVFDFVCSYYGLRLVFVNPVVPYLLSAC